MGKDKCAENLGNNLGFHKMIHSCSHHLFLLFIWIQVKKSTCNPHSIHVHQNDIQAFQQEAHSFFLYMYCCTENCCPAEGSRELNPNSFTAQFEFHSVHHVGKYLISLRKIQWDNSLGRLSHYPVPVITACP